MTACSDFKFFSTWALLIHSIIFLMYATYEVFYASLALGNAFVELSMPVGSGISVSVATSVTFVLSDNWHDMYDLYCQDSDSCLDFTLRFILSHYLPPISYFITYILNRDHESKKQKMHFSPLRWNILFQAILVPSGLYSSTFDIDEIYGTGSKIKSVFIYWSFALIFSLFWSLRSH